MNTRQIEKVLNRHCSIFRGVFAADQLPIPQRRPILIIANEQKSSLPGSHWFAIFFDVGGEGEFFDSFGRRPTGIFERYMDLHSTTWIYNDRQLQSITSRFCGHYCILYAVYKNRRYSMRNIIKMYGNNHVLNDYNTYRFVRKMLY